ncbi:MAG: VOC family protein [Bacteroidota bacterium]
MATVNVYLTFGGNCKEAFDFYSAAFGKEISDHNTFGEMPPQDGMPPMPEDMKDQIMHISLPIGEGTVLMGSDHAPWGPPLQAGNNFSISVNPSSEAEAEQIFHALAEGGTVSMPLAKTFWQAYFGMLTDKFGINWMVNFELPA